MNKRIAKKLSRHDYFPFTYGAWIRGYGPEDMGDHKRRVARKVLNRKNTSFRRSMNILHRCGYFSGPPVSDTPENRRRLIDAWDQELRPHLLKYGPGEVAHYSCGEKKGMPITEESVWAGQESGMQEIYDALQRGHSLFEFALDFLHYFSDRWTPRRLGRMWAMINALRVDLDKPVQETGLLP